MIFWATKAKRVRFVLDDLKLFISYRDMNSEKNNCEKITLLKKLFRSSNLSLPNLFSAYSMKHLTTNLTSFGIFGYAIVKLISTFNYTG